MCIRAGGRADCPGPLSAGPDSAMVQDLSWTGGTCSSNSVGLRSRWSGHAAGSGQHRPQSRPAGLLRWFGGSAQPRFTRLELGRPCFLLPAEAGSRGRFLCRAVGGLHPLGAAQCQRNALCAGLITMGSRSCPCWKGRSRARCCGTASLFQPRLTWLSLVRPFRSHRTAGCSRSASSLEGSRKPCVMVPCSRALDLPFPMKMLCGDGPPEASPKDGLSRLVNRLRRRRARPALHGLTAGHGCRKHRPSTAPARGEALRWPPL